MSKKPAQTRMKKQPSAGAPGGSAPAALPGSARQGPLSRVWHAIGWQSTVIFAVAIMARALHYFFMRDALVYQVLISDAWQYDLWAQKIASGQWLGTEVFYQTPLYPYTMAVLYTLFGHNVWVVRWFQAILGSVACVFLSRAGNRYFSPRVGWIAGLLLALYPPALFFDGIVQKASIDLCLMTGLLWTLSTIDARPRWTAVAGAGLLVGLLTLNRENAAILFPVLLVWFTWLWWPDLRWQGLRRLALFCLGIATVLLPVGFRNQYVAGTFLLTTAQFGPNFYYGNHHGADGCYEPLRPGRGDARHERDDARLLAEQDLKRSLTTSEVSQYWFRRALADIRTYPGEWLRLMAWKLFLTWNTLELVDGEGLRVHQHFSPLLSALGWVLTFGTLCPLAAIGLWLTRHDWRRLWLLYFMLLAFAGTMTLFILFARYRYPLVPVVVLFAAAGIVGTWDWWFGGRGVSTREITLGALWALPVAIICNWPLPHLYNDEITYFNIGTGLLDINRPREAIEPLQRSLQFNPPIVYNNLGRVYVALKEWDNAKQSFHQAVALQPNLAVAHYGLAEVAEQQHDMAEAIAQARATIQLDRLSVDGYRLLGRLQLQTGDPSAAVETFRQAVTVEPKSGVLHSELGMALAAQGELAAAVEELRTAHQLAPRLLAPANNLAWILATTSQDAVRRPDEALALAEEFCQVTHFEVPELLDTLAAACAAAGKWDDARRHSARAIELATQQKNEELLKGLRERQALYAADKPYREAVAGSTEKRP